VNLDKRNISLTDILFIYLYWSCLFKLKLIISFIKVCKLFRNHLSVTINIIKKRYPIRGILKNGNVVVLDNESELSFYLNRSKEFVYNFANDTISLSKYSFNDKTNITIHGGISNGEFINIFMNNFYKSVPVENKVVIDVGANIGDSAIYFVLRGAKKVICVEPFPRNYELAKKNIEFNNLSSKISVILAGCSDRNGKIKIDPDYKSTDSSILSHFKVGIEVPLMTLENILNENNLRNDNSLILKIDCEGCEYRSILLADGAILRRFTHMVIEYHHGYKNLKKKLQDSNFKVSVTRPRTFSFTSDLIKQKLDYTVGLIFAKRDLSKIKDN